MIVSSGPLPSPEVNTINPTKQVNTVWGRRFQKFVLSVNFTLQFLDIINNAIKYIFVHIFHAHT